MTFLLNHPFVLFTITLAFLWIISRVGAFFRKLWPDRGLDESYFTLLLASSLTLLSLIIGFTFSLAASRYDQRKNYEQQEASAIGTEYLRLDALPAADAVQVRVLLRDYLHQRIVYYTTHDAEVLEQVKIKTSQLQSDLWSAAMAPTTAEPGPTSALVLSGMNDVLNSEGYTEAAWSNRVPPAAWILLFFTAAFCNLLLGYRAPGRNPALFLILPITLAVSLFLIVEIDSPRNGVIQVPPQNLQRVADSFHNRSSRNFPIGGIGFVAGAAFRGKVSAASQFAFPVPYSMKLLPKDRPR
jgi:hypothetical protein